MTRIRTLRLSRLSGRFTIIELLVVIAIITILASLLLPALGKARQVAHKAVCLANQKQISIACYNYAEESDGFRAPYFHSPVGYGRTWASLLIRNGAIGGDLSKIQRPDGNIFWCPMDRDPVNVPGSTNFMYYGGSYTYNNRGAADPLSGGSNQCEKRDRHSRPQDFVETTDNFSESGISVTSMYNFSNSNYTNKIGERHNGAANVAYLDGHAEYRKKTDLTITKNILWQ